MAQSTLDQTGESKPGLGKGHGTGALGPITSIYLYDPDGNLIEIASAEVAS